MKINLQPLYELRERLESSMIAGISLLSDDFRLARAVEQMETLAGASPIFKRIYDTAQSALAPGCSDRCGAVLDVYSLVDAVLCTQGIVETDGEISNITLAEGKRVVSNAPYSVLAPLLEALTTTGSGHYSTVVNMHKDHPELFQDYRLKDALIKGLGAGYSELADQVETWLCEEGEDIVPLLKHGLDPRGKKEMVRRIRVIEALRKEKDNSYYIALLDTAEKEVREAAIYALRHDKGNIQLLLDLVKGEKGNCKKAAQSALISMDSPQALEYWQSSMEKKPGTNAPFLALSHSDAMSDLLAAALEKMTDRLLAYAGERKPISNADITTMNNLLGSISGKSSPAVCAWYRRAVQRPVADAMDALLDIQNKPVHFYTFGGCGSGYYSDDHRDNLTFRRLILNVLTHSILCFPDRRLFALADELFESVGTEYLKPALVSALFAQSAPEVYDRFSLYFEDKKREDHSFCVKALENVMQYLWFNNRTGKYEMRAVHPDPLYNRERTINHANPIYEPLDHRWFRLLTSDKLNTTPSPYSLGTLINPNDPVVCDILGEYFYRRALDPMVDSRRVFSQMKTCGWVGEKCKGVIVEGIKKPYNRSFWNFQQLVTDAPLTYSQKADEVEEVRRMVHKHEINIKGWNDQTIQDLCAQLREDAKSEGQERQT